MIRKVQLGSLATATQDAGATSKIHPWYQLPLAADWGAILAYSALVMFAVAWHEPWCDEAHSWVLVRNVGLWRTLTKYLHYEGAPGLWHVFIWLLQALRVPYAGFNYASALVAIGGACFFVRYAPFPPLVRRLFPFTYFLGYQYAVIARNYVFLPLLLFVALHLLPRAKEHPLRFTAVLALLANVSVHGTLMAGGLAVIHLMSLQGPWAGLDHHTRRQHIIAAGLLAAVLAIIALQAFPAYDSVGVWMMDRGIHRKLLDVLRGFDGALFEVGPLSAVGLFIIGWWCFTQGAGEAFLLLVVPLGFFYGLIYRNLYHQGTIVLALVANCWIAAQRMRRPEGRPRRKVVAMVVLAWMCVHLYWTGMAVWHDHWDRYSAGEAAAAYIRPLVEQGKTIYGYDFRTVAIQPYFDVNPFANERRLGPAWLQSIGWRATVNSEAKTLAEAPDYIVVGIMDIKTALAAAAFQRNGYAPTVFVKGALIWKDRTQQPESFAILRRVDPYTPPPEGGIR
jgi:hypothetical protein